MPVLVEIGLLVLCCCAGAALCVLAQCALARVQRLGREHPDDVAAANRHMAIKERELDLEEQKVANARRALDLRERELAIEEADDEGEFE